MLGRYNLKKKKNNNDLKDSFQHLLIRNSTNFGRVWLNYFIKMNFLAQQFLDFAVDFLRPDNSNLFWEEIVEEPINFDNFEALFAKVTVESKRKTNANKAKAKVVQVRVSFAWKIQISLIGCDLYEWSRLIRLSMY